MWHQCRKLTPRFMSHSARVSRAMLQLDSVSMSRSLHMSPELLAKIIECPAFADSISEGDISWIKEVGDSVQPDETVGEVETDKTSLPINAPTAGVVTKVRICNKLSTSPEILAPRRRWRNCHPRYSSF